MDTNTAVPEFRKRALKKLTIGILGCLGAALLLIAIASGGHLPNNPFMLIPAGIPFVYFCIGTVELLTGRPFQQLAQAWMTLKGWQRGVIGTLIILVAAFLIGIVATAIAMWVT